MTLKAFCFSARLNWPCSLMPHSWEIMVLPSGLNTSTWASRSQSIQKFAPLFMEPKGYFSVALGPLIMMPASSLVRL